MSDPIVTNENIAADLASVIEEFYNLKFFPSGKLGYKHHFQYGNISTYFYKKNGKLANH